MLSVLQAWANLEWMALGFKNQNHYHRCTECRIDVCCRCEDKDALWTTCSECSQQLAA